MNTLLAQVEIHERTEDTCVSDNGFCPGWIVDNFDRYVDPFFQHVLLTVVAVAIGFLIAFTLALVAYRRRWLDQPGHPGHRHPLHDPEHRGLLPAAANHRARLRSPRPSRSSPTSLLIIFRNILTGLDNVPEDTKDAGRGMGLTDRQLLWRVEVPLALPEIMAGLRIAVTTAVGLATLAFFAGAGGLGEQIFADITFKSNVVVAGGLPCCWRRCSTGHPAGAAHDHPWTRAAAAPMNPEFADAIQFIFNEHESPAGGAQVGGLSNMWD